MLTAKQILLLITQIFCAVCFAQTKTIDSLKKVLPLLKDTARIDCLNELSNAFILADKKDSANGFANLAYNESEKINYIHGAAVSLLQKSKIYKHFDDDLIESEKLAKESLNIFNKTSNKKGLYDVYQMLMYSTFGQSRFDEAIEFAKKKYALSNESGDAAGMFSALMNIGTIYKDAGNYEQSLYYGQLCRQLAIKTGNQEWLQNTLFVLGELCMKINDYNTALTNFRQAFQMDNPQLEKSRKDGDFDIWMKMEYAEIFSHLYQFDSAWHYFELYKPTLEDDRYFRIYLVSTGEYYFLQKEYEKALQNFLKGLQLHKKLNDRNEVQRTLIFVAQTYLALGNDTAAMRYAREAIATCTYNKSKTNYQ